MATLPLTSRTMELVLYIKQLDLACLQKGVTLAAVCEAEGLPASTLWRWRKGKTLVSEPVAIRLFERINAKRKRPVA